MIMKLQKEVCQPCKKFISIGQPILECEKCTVAIHTKCHKTAEFCCDNGIWLCCICSGDVEKRYNPFPYQTYDSSDCTEKFYNNDHLSHDPILQSISNTLTSCKKYSVHEFKSLTDEIITSQINMVPVSSQPPSNMAQQPTKSTPVSLLFNNIDGNNTNFDQFLIELKRLDFNFLAIGLAETNTDEALKELYKIPLYNSSYQNTLTGKSKGSGVALYVHHSINTEPLENISFCNPDIESLFIKTTNTPETHIIGTIYRPPSGDLSNFLKSFELILSTVPKKGVHIMGDFNINLFNDTCKSKSQFEDIFFSNGFAPTNSIATHERINCKSSCIDNIFTNDIEKVTLSGAFIDKIGEHSLIFEISNSQISLPNTSEKHVINYNYSNANVTKFIDKLVENIDKIEPSEKFHEFSDLVHSTLDQTCKLEKPRLTKRTPLNNPWITEGLVIAISRKHELKNEWVKTITKKNQTGDQSLYQVFSDYRKLLKPIINSAKNLYFCGKILEHKENKKKTWEVINEIRGKSKNVLKPPIVINNEKIMNRRKIANEFNKYFNSIASSLNEAIDESTLNNSIFCSFEEFMTKRIQNTIFLEDCDENEILEIISELQNGKSSDIPIFVIKKAAHVFSFKLAEYFNILMKHGIFPDELKIGKVTPIYKKGNLEDIGNYRPVSTLPIFGKIFEKVIYTRLYKFAMSQNILHENQFGFRKTHSTCHAVNHSISIIEESIRQHRHMLGIFIDLSKAFDTIDHKILISKLDRYGIRGKANCLIQSYLMNRKQYTETLGEKSDKLMIQYGVPQGSVLGPLLFLLYINDISNCSELGKFVLFADDTNIFVDGTTIEEAYKNGNRLLSSLSKYMVLNKLHINMTKCCYIHFPPNNYKKTDSDMNINLLINNFPIKKVDKTKFLGVIIDEKLSWGPHTLNLKRTLNYATATLNRIMNNVPRYLLRELYYTLFESHLSYCISVWGDAAMCRLQPLWIAQKHCIRVLFGDREKFLNKFKTCARTRPIHEQNLDSAFFEKEHSKPLFKENTVLSLFNLYAYHCLMETFKILKFHYPIPLHSSYNISSRKKVTLILNFPSKNFTYRSSVLWNSVAPKLKINDYSENVSLIRSQLKKTIVRASA